MTYNYAEEPLTELEIYDKDKQLLQPDTCPECDGSNVRAVFEDNSRQLVRYSCEECGATKVMPYYEHVMFMGQVLSALHGDPDD